MNNILSRSLSRVRAIVSWGGQEHAHLAPEQLEDIRVLMQECAETVGGEVTARQRAARLAKTYQRLDDNDRHALLRMIALEFGPDPIEVAKAHQRYQDAVGTTEQWNAEAKLRSTMRSRRIRILTQFNAMPDGVKFLVDLRADLLRFLKEDPELKALDRELESRLAGWFDVGFLELRRITWESPAALLEKLVEYEAVHEISSWDDLKNRLDTDRRCYGFFHPRMPHEPLIFVEVALTNALADDVQSLLDVKAPLTDAAKADTAIFYSISNTQVGLRGVSFGNFLLKRVIDDLKPDLPNINQYATLSPIPLFRSWVKQNPTELVAAVTDADWKKLSPLGVDSQDPAAFVELLEQVPWEDNPALAQHLKAPLTRLAARYLSTARRGDTPYDPVARFHLGNGARIERVHWMADTSAKGMKQSYGLMVNYLYNPEAIEHNVESYVREGEVVMSGSIRRMTKG